MIMIKVVMIVKTIRQYPSGGRKGWTGGDVGRRGWGWARGPSHWQESRSRENLEKKWLIFFSLELENCIFISLSLLDFQDCADKILFLLSIYEILFSVSLSLPVRNASYFREKYAFFRVWVVVENCYVMRFWGIFDVRKGSLTIKI